MNWEEKKLPTRTEPGYGEKELPPAELISTLGGEVKPLVVWFYSLDDERRNRTLETSVFCEEGIALSLKMFRTVKINVESIGDSRIKKKYGDTPGFFFYDPKKELLASIIGGRAVSVSKFKGVVERAWAPLFETRRRDFIKAMKKILDRLDKVSGNKTVLQAQKTRLAQKPNARKARQIRQEEAELAAEEAKIKADEDEIMKRCKLRKKYLEPAEEGGEK